MKRVDIPNISIYDIKPKKEKLEMTAKQKKKKLKENVTNLQ